jgi:hypothetical protein
MDAPTQPKPSYMLIGIAGAISMMVGIWGMPITVYADWDCWYGQHDCRHMGDACIMQRGCHACIRVGCLHAYAEAMHAKLGDSACVGDACMHTNSGGWMHVGDGCMWGLDACMPFWKHACRLDYACMLMGKHACMIGSKHACILIPEIGD